MQPAQKLQQLTTRSGILSLGIALLLTTAAGCTESPTTTTTPAPAVTEAEANPTPPSPAPEPAPAKPQRRINPGADIANEPLVATDGTILLEFDLTGMTCASCAGTITTATAAITGVEKIRISLLQNKAWLLLKETTAQATAVAEIIAAVQAAGEYTATPVNPPNENPSPPDQG